MVILLWIIFGALFVIGVVTQFFVFKIARKNNFLRSELTESDRKMMRKISGIRILAFFLAVVSFILVFYFNRK